jgi:hypothetical protein
MSTYTVTKVRKEPPYIETKRDSTKEDNLENLDLC